MGSQREHFMDCSKVSELPQSPKFTPLIELYLRGNYELTAIPPLFFHRMARLQVLDLSHTSIKSLPKSLLKLVALKKLLLRDCQLFMQLPPDVGKLKNLEELDLDQTQIMELPRDIGKLLKLRHLRVSFYPICGKNMSKSNIVIHPDSILILSQLAELSIDVDPLDKRWADSVEAVVKELCNSKALRNLRLHLPKFQLLDSISLLYPSLSSFRFTIGHHKRRIISRVPHEVEAEFRKWDKCLKFVNGENIPIQIKAALKYSTSFFLDKQATARNLSEFGVKNMKSLKFCLLAECNRMETVIDGERPCEDDLLDSDPSSGKNVLESLEHLSIYYMENLGSICRGPNCYGCMSKLRFLALHTCPKLIHIFSHSLLENFVNLEELILEDCPLIASLISHASAKPVMSDILLPSLKRLLLLYLPELVSISNGLPIAPKLESIGFYNCPKLKCISKMELSSKSLKLIKGECQWWEDLKWNETELGNKPDYLMQIFSPVNNEKDVMTQLAEDRDLFEATKQNEGQQLGNCGSLLSNCTEGRVTGTYATNSTPYVDIPRTTTSVLPSPAKGEFSVRSLKQKSNSGNDQRSTMSELEDNSSCVCHMHQPSYPTTSSLIYQPSAATLPNARLQALLPQSFEEVAKQSESKGNLQGNYGNNCKQYSDLGKSRKSDEAYTWRCYGIKEMVGNRRRSYYRCARLGCPAKKWVEIRSLDGQITQVIHKALHNHPESKPTRARSLSAFSQIIRASNHLTIKIPDHSFVTYEGGEVDPEAAASVVYMRLLMDENFDQLSDRLGADIGDQDVPDSKKRQLSKANIVRIYH